MRIRLLTFIFVAIIAISSASIFVVLAEAPGMVAAFWRLTLSLPILFVIYRPKIILSKLPVLAGVALALHFAFWMESLFHASVAVSTTIVCTHSIFSGIFAAAKGEKPKVNQVIGVLVAMIGVYMLSGADSRADILGITLALLGAIAGGFYFASARFAANINFGSYVFTTYTSAAVVSLILCILTNAELFTYPAKTWMFFALLAAIPMLIGHSLLNYVLRYMVVLPVNASVIGEAVGAAVLASIVLGQTLSVEAYACMFVVLFGIAITFYDFR